jgi:hypothetical protein
MAIAHPNQDNNPQSGVAGTSYMYEFGTSPNTRTAVSQKVRLLTPHYGNSLAMHQMGVVSTFNPTQSRNIDNIRSVGFGDHIAELVPGPTDPATASFERALLYLCNLWQATGYASGIDGPVRSLAHHKWPFDLEQQLVFSSLVDADLGRANQGMSGQSGQFDGGLKAIQFPQVTNDTTGMPGADNGMRGHSAIITIYEACWFNDWNTSFTKDQGFITENGTMTISDIHDFSSVYGEFLATGNDPTIGQLGSIRFAKQGLGTMAQAGAGAGLGNPNSPSIQALQGVRVGV